MVEKKRSISRSHKTLGAHENYHTIYVKEPINIEATGNIKDASQKDFELIIQTVGIRSMPIAFDEPEYIKSLGKHCSLKGKGWKWSFAVEHPKALSEILIKELLHGMVLSDGVLDFDGSYDKRNIEVIDNENR